MASWSSSRSTDPSSSTRSRYRGSRAGRAVRRPRDGRGCARHPVHGSGGPRLRGGRRHPRLRRPDPGRGADLRAADPAALQPDRGASPGHDRRRQRVRPGRRLRADPVLRPRGGRRHRTLRPAGGQPRRDPGRGGHAAAGPHRGHAPGEGTEPPGGDDRRPRRLTASASRTGWFAATTCRARRAPWRTSSSRRRPSRSG
jgi:hypothetical protein